MNFEEQLPTDREEPVERLPSDVIERMKIVFRSTHGAEMNEEDRNVLGIPACEEAGETFDAPSILVLLQ